MVVMFAVFPSARARWSVAARCMHNAVVRSVAVRAGQPRAVFEQELCDLFPSYVESVLCARVRGFVTIFSRVVLLPVQWRDESKVQRK